MCRKKSIRRGLTTLLVLVLSVGAVPAFAGDTDDSEVTSDPLEGMNRGIFWFNEQVDRFMLHPASVAWDTVLPDAVERSIRHAYDNASSPVVFVNDILQGKPHEAAVTFARFVFNTTLGVGGFFDPATFMGLEERKEDFGQTLGVWGVPRGPYLVLPIYGPSNPRDAFGLAVDSAARVWPFFAPFYASAAIGSVDAVNRRSLNAETIEEERAAAFDFYAAVRNAYVQRRDNQVRDQADDESESDEDLYYTD